MINSNTKHQVRKRFNQLIINTTEKLIPDESNLSVSYSEAYFIDKEIKGKLTIVKKVAPKTIAFYSFCWYLSQLPQPSPETNIISDSAITRYLIKEMRCTLYLYNKSNNDKSYRELNGMVQLEESISSLTLSANC